MNSLQSKLLLAVNLVFILISAIFLLNSYTEAVDMFDRAEEKVRIEEKIQKETDIEKLRKYTMLGVEIQNGANKMVYSLLEFVKYLVLTFCSVLCLNIFGIYAHLRQGRDLTNRQS